MGSICSIPLWRSYKSLMGNFLLLKVLFTQTASSNLPSFNLSLFTEPCSRDRERESARARGSEGGRERASEKYEKQREKETH